MATNSVATSLSSKTNKIFKALTAVDLITVVVFAILFRILFLVYKLAEIVFPWNHPVWYFFAALTLIPALLITRKVGATFLYTVAWLAFNFFFQGEIALWWIGALTIPIIPEIYLYYRSKQSGTQAVFTNLKDLLIVGGIYTLLAYATNIVLILFALLNPMPRILVWPVGALALVLGLLGAWAGYWLGKRISGLIG